MQLKIDTEEQTKEVAIQIGQSLQLGDVVFLIGDLGAGKTTFSRYLIKSLGDEGQTVPSPTFTLVQSYALSPAPLDHYDLYRLEGDDLEDDIIELGWEDSLSNGVTLVEWPDRLGALTPHDRLEVNIIIHDDDTRTITLIPYGDFKNRNLNLEEK